MAVAEAVHLTREVPWGLIEFEQRPPDPETGREYRAYHVTETGKRRRRVPSVTTILGVLNKPALARWHERMGVEAGVEGCRDGLLTDVALEDCYGALADAKRGAKDRAQSAAARGIEVHALIDTYLTTGEPPIPVDFPQETRGYVRGAVSWLLGAERRGLEVLATERLVADPVHGFAGRFDLRARLDGRLLVVDFKSNARASIYAEHHYQPAAYALADMACGEAMVDGGLVVAIGADGSYTEREAVGTPEDFLRILGAYGAVQRVEKAARNGRAAA
jgi:hypothetical protein